MNPPPALRAACLAALAALACAQGAAASRAPTAKERSRIAFTVRTFPTIGRQNTVKVTAVHVSSADPRWAAVRFTVRDASGAPVGKLGAILLRSTDWRVVYLGPFPLTCISVPGKVRADLLPGHVCG